MKFLLRCNKFDNQVRLEGLKAMDSEAMLQVIQANLMSSTKRVSGELSIAQSSVVWFYGISTIVGYLISNPVYTYILDLYDLTLTI